MKLAQRLAEAHNLAQPILHRDLTARLDVSMKDWLRRTVQFSRASELSRCRTPWTNRILAPWIPWTMASEETPTQGRAGVHKVHQVLQPHCPQKVVVALDELDELFGLNNWTRRRYVSTDRLLGCEIHQIEKRLRAVYVMSTDRLTDCNWAACPYCQLSSPSWTSWLSIYLCRGLTKHCSNIQDQIFPMVWYRLYHTIVWYRL